MTMILIVAVHGNFSDSPEPLVEIYEAASKREADQFCDLWEKHEIREAKHVGGYPGEAFVLDGPTADMTAEEWIVNFGPFALGG